MQYSKKVMKYFLHPKNMGKLKNPDAIGKVGNMICGDVMHIYIKVGKNKKGEEIIKNVKVLTTGCVAAIATSSMITEIAKGKTLKEAMKITNKDVADSLGKLPPIKMHCSNLAAEALHRAIKNYLNKKNSKNRSVKK